MYNNKDLQENKFKLISGSDSNNLIKPVDLNDTNFIKVKPGFVIVLYEKNPNMNLDELIDGLPEQYVKNRDSKENEGPFYNKCQNKNQIYQRIKCNKEDKSKSEVCSFTGKFIYDNRNNKNFKNKRTILNGPNGPVENATCYDCPEAHWLGCPSKGFQKKALHNNNEISAFDGTLYKADNASSLPNLLNKNNPNEFSEQEKAAGCHLKGSINQRGIKCNSGDPYTVSVCSNLNNSRRIIYQGPQNMIGKNLTCEDCPGAKFLGCEFEKKRSSLIKSTLSLQDRLNLDSNRVVIIRGIQKEDSVDHEIIMHDVISSGMIPKTIPEILLEPLKNNSWKLPGGGILFRGENKNISKIDECHIKYKKSDNSNVVSLKNLEKLLLRKDQKFQYLEILNSNNSGTMFLKTSREQCKKIGGENFDENPIHNLEKNGNEFKINTAKNLVKKSDQVDCLVDLCNVNNHENIFEKLSGTAWEKYFNKLSQTVRDANSIIFKKGGSTNSLKNDYLVSQKHYILNDRFNYLGSDKSKCSNNSNKISFEIDKSEYTGSDNRICHNLGAIDNKTKDGCKFELCYESDKGIIKEPFISKSIIDKINNRVEIFYEHNNKLNNSFLPLGEYTGEQILKHIKNENKNQPNIDKITLNSLKYVTTPEHLNIKVSAKKKITKIKDKVGKNSMMDTNFFTKTNYNQTTNRPNVTTKSVNEGFINYVPQNNWNNLGTNANPGFKNYSNF